MKKLATQGPTLNAVGCAVHIGLKLLNRLGLATVGMTLAQAFVRRAAPSPWREAIWRWGMWQSKDFVARADGLLISGNTLDLVQGYLYWFGVWEPNLTDFIRRRMNLAPTRTFIDVGANIGYFSMLVAKHYASSSVVSIEAFPPIAEKLRSNIKRNALNNVRIIEAAASDAVGAMELFYAGNRNEGGTSSVPGKFDSIPVKVPSRPLADLLTDEEVKSARLIKIDVEGAEALVVAGFEPKLDTLPEDAEIVIEVSTGSALAPNAMFSALLARGFYAYEIHNDYNASAYLYPEPIKRPLRITTPPSKQADVVFSRINATHL